jgi:hypothetical protein
MPPIRNESPADKATRLLQKANQINQKVSYNRVMAALKARPDLCCQIEAQLAAYNCLDPLLPVAGSKQQSSPAELPKPPVGPLALLDNGSGAQASDAGPPPHRDDEEPAEVALPSLEDDKKFEKNIAMVGQVPAKTLKKALMQCEPAAFSEGNFKAILKRGAKDVNARYLLDLLEYCTNLGDSTSLPPGCRSHSAFIHWVMKTYHEKGRRGRDLQLQAAMPWDKVGVYAVEKRGTQLYCVNKSLGQEVAIPVVGEASDFLIDTNFSELRAVIGSTQTHYRQPCVLLFGTALLGADATPQKGVKRPRSSPSPGASLRSVGSGLSAQSSSSAAMGSSAAASLAAAGAGAPAEVEPEQEEGSEQAPAASGSKASAEAGFVPPIPSGFNESS